MRVNLLGMLRVEFVVIAWENLLLEDVKNQR